MNIGAPRLVSDQGFGVQMLVVWRVATCFSQPKLWATPPKSWKRFGLM